MNNPVWYVLHDSDTYRSLSNPSVHPRVFLDLAERFRDGKVIGDAWDPPYLYLDEETGEDSKPMGSFPGFSGFFVIGKTALEVLYPIIESTIIEILPLPCSVEGLSVLNIKKVDCIDHSRSRFRYFSSGKIMRVERFAFVQQNLEGKHIFRLEEESFAKVFADDVFKTSVEENELHGLSFFALDQA